MLSLSDALARFGEALAARGASPRTIAAYAADLATLAAFLARRVSPALEDVTELDVFALRAWLADRALCLRPSSLARHVSAARSFCRWMLRAGLHREDPAAFLVGPKVQRSDPRPLDVETVADVVEAPRGDGVLLRRDRAILEILYATGMRCSELCALDLASLDLRRREARVVGKGDKERRVYLGRPAVRAVRAWLRVRGRVLAPGAEDPGAVFLGARGERIGRSAVYAVVRAAGERTGRPGVSPHALRHACATHLLEGGAGVGAIREILGHTRLSTTQRYTHVSAQHLCAVYDRAHPLAQPRARRPGSVGA